MRTWLVAIVMLVVCGCSSATPRARASTPPKATPVTLSAPSPSPSPLTSPTPPSVLASLTCRIAVSTGSAGSGGFVAFPGGQFAADKSSDVDLPGQTGSDGLAYSVVLQKWVPVDRDWLAPDGKRYLYWNWTQDTVELVNAANGSQSGVSGTFTSGNTWSILDAEQNAAYVWQASSNEGLWTARYAGGLQQITTTGYWQAATGNFAYGTETSSVPQGAANTIVRLDTTTKSKQDWFSEPGLQGTVRGFAADGSPIVVASKPAGTQNGQPMTDQEVWLATGPMQAQRLFQVTFVGAVSPYGGASPGGVTSVLGDSHGIWISVQNQGTYLWTSVAGLEHASAVSGELDSGCD